MYKLQSFLNPNWINRFLILFSHNIIFNEKYMLCFVLPIKFLNFRYAKKKFYEVIKITKFIFRFYTFFRKYRLNLNLIGLSKKKFAFGFSLFLNNY